MDPKPNNTFRASFSILNTWKSGNWERAIKMYFKLEEFTTQAMAAGKDWHKEWEEQIKVSNSLPLELGGKKLIAPKEELKLVAPLYPWLNLVGVIDCYDSPTIYEFKTGRMSSENYAGSPQAGVYAVLATYSGLYVDRAEIHHYDQYSKKHDMSLVWITDKMLSDSFNWITTLAGEMHNYFEVNKLYEKYGHNLIK